MPEFGRDAILLMTQLMHEIEWSAPLLPRVHIPEWEATVKASLGGVPDIFMRVSRSRWIREAVFKWPRYEVQEFPKKLSDICALVTAQENACRYCYGVARSQMRLFGYSERMIRSIERDMQKAELDEKERAFVQFCRNLSRSNPRPPKSGRDKLIALGFSSLAVAEMAFLITSHCFVNRVSTFLAVPPMGYFEKLPGSFRGRLFRPLIARKIRKLEWNETTKPQGEIDSFPSVIRSLAGLPAGKARNDALKGAFESDVLSNELKILMFAVIARSLGCRFCERETRNMALDFGFAEAEFDRALNTLSSPRLSEEETKILAWTRETVHFQTGPMQKRISALVRELDEEVLLEAMGMAALANTTVRLAVLID
jgi:alkylhydroperoxidase family enzyme